MKINQLLARHLSALIRHQKETGGPMATLAAVEAETKRRGLKVGRSTIDRMCKGESSFSIAYLEVVASAFGLELWQILMPDMDPASAPVPRPIASLLPQSEQAARVAQLFDRLTFGKDRVTALGAAATALLDAIPPEAASHS